MVQPVLTESIAVMNDLRRSCAQYVWPPSQESVWGIDNGVWCGSGGSPIDNVGGFHKRYKSNFLGYLLVAGTQTIRYALQKDILHDGGEFANVEVCFRIRARAATEGGSLVRTHCR